MMLRLPLTLVPLLASAATRDEEEFVTELRHLPEGWLMVGCLALIVAVCWGVVWMYRREGRIGATLRTRMILACLRCLVMLMLAVILFEPVRVRILRRWIDSYTVVLVDDSSSMDLTDAYRDEAAAERIKRAMGVPQPGPVRRASLVRHELDKENRRFLTELAENNRVKLYAFSDQPQLIGTIRATREKVSQRDNTGEGSQTMLAVDAVGTELAATGPATNIERAVRRTVESLGSAPVAAVVVFSDGGFNQGASSEDTARFARQRRVPIHVVGIGDPSSPQNVRVTEILAPTNAFQKDPFAVSARLTADGLEGRMLRVELRERNATDGGSGRIVDSRNAVVGPRGTVDPVTFERRQDRVGRFVYTVEVAPLDSETVTDDNSKQTTVNVIDSRTRVLVVAGGPSWDYRFVTRLLERDATFEVSCWLQSADYSAVRDGNTVIDHLPITAEELFEYDVIVLMDPDREELSESWCRLIDTLVTQYGGGLLFAAARPNMPSLMRDRALKPLFDLLPVSMDPQADLVLNEVGHYQLSGSALSIPSTVYGHPIMKQAGDPVSTKLVWQGIGAIYWHYPVLREKPVATVLMRHGNPKMRNSFGGHVLAAVQFVGAGRTGFLAFDGTWRWRRYGVAIFDRFWVQFVRYLAEGKLLGGTKRGMLLTESDQYSLGEAVTVTARLFDRRYEPLKRDQVLVQFSVDGHKGDFTMSARRDRPGWFEGRFVPDRTGSYRISMMMAQPDAGDLVEIAREIRVARPNIEILRPQMDRAKLVTLAEQSHGGRYFEVDEAANLPGIIPDLHEEIPIRSRPTSLWDNWITLTVLLVLLTLEWGVRKWNRML